MKNLFFPAALATVLLVASSCSNSTDSRKVADDQNKEKFKNTDSVNDAEFVVKAVDANMLEVQLGELAKKTAMTEDVKQLAQHMVDDHTKANNQLKALAGKKNISIPSILSDKSQGKYDDMVKKTGMEFDKSYSDQMVKEHKDAIDLFQEEVAKGKDAEVKEWASGKLPDLQAHLNMAEKTYTGVKNNK